MGIEFEHILKATFLAHLLPGFSIFAVCFARILFIRSILLPPPLPSHPPPRMATESDFSSFLCTGQIAKNLLSEKALIHCSSGRRQSHLVQWCFEEIRRYCLLVWRSHLWSKYRRWCARTSHTLSWRCFFYRKKLVPWHNSESVSWLEVYDNGISTLLSVSLPKLVSWWKLRWWCELCDEVTWVCWRRPSIFHNQRTKKIEGQVNKL